MIDIVVRDYLAAEEVKLRIDGLTVLRGESYSGKSSTFRAIQAAVQNRFPVGCVRWGATSCSVALRFDGSSEILKVSKSEKGGAVYELGSVKFEKTRREVPQEVVSFLNLGSLVSGADRLSLSFWEQFSRPLLRAFSQSKVSDLLGGGQSLKDWGEANKALISRRGELKGEESVLITHCAKAQEEVAAWEALLAEAAPLVSLVKDLDVRITTSAETLQSLRLLSTAYESRTFIGVGVTHGSAVLESCGGVEHLLAVCSSFEDLLGYVKALEEDASAVRVVEEGVALIDACLASHMVASGMEASLQQLYELLDLVWQSKGIGVRLSTMQCQGMLMECAERRALLAVLDGLVGLYARILSMQEACVACLGVLDQLILLGSLSEECPALVRMCVEESGISPLLKDSVCPYCGHDLDKDEYGYDNR